MANYEFSRELLDDILFRTGLATGGVETDFEGTVLKYLNRAYFFLVSGSVPFDDIKTNWLFFKKDPPGTLTLEYAVVTGTVNVANNSTAITFSSAPAASMQGRMLLIDGLSERYRISAHTGGSVSAILDSVYTNPDSTAIAYKAVKLEYDLPSDFVRFMSPMRVFQSNQNEITGLSTTKFDIKYPLVFVKAGTPVNFTMVTGTKVRFSHYGSETVNELMRIEYDYISMPAALTNSSSETPLVPLLHRHVLADIATALIALDTNDSRYKAKVDIAKSSLRSMRDEQQKAYMAFSNSFGYVSPQPKYDRNALPG